MSTYIWKTKFTSYKQYFFFEKCKENWRRPKYTTSFPNPVLKETTHKPLKVVVCLSLIQLPSVNVFHYLHNNFTKMLKVYEV